MAQDYRYEPVHPSAPGRAPVRGGWGGAPVPKKKHTGLWAVVLVLCLAGTALLAALAAPQVLGIRYVDLPNYAFVNGNILALDTQRTENLRTYRDYMNQDAIFPGVYIDGVHVGGMTLDEAREALGGVEAQGGGSFAIQVEIDGQHWQIDSDQVPMTRNLEEILAQAWAQGRQNTTAIRGSGMTPFEERLQAALDLRSNPVSYTTELTFDRAAIRTITDGIAEGFNVEPVNAAVASFDFNTRSFSFTEDQSGIALSADELYNQVIGKLDAGIMYDTVSMHPETVLAPVTRAELMNSFHRVSTYTTETTSNANRNTNIDLAAQAINGTTVKPGETFSFNAATGQRTEEKGYREAAAISGGQSIPEVGGGVCQVSSTLFNAVARANLEIVSRSPHAWPSSYVGKGMDATVDWPNLDFKFRNDTDWPVFIIASYAKRKVTVEIYGMGLGDGVSIDLEAEVVQELTPPSSIAYVLNPNLPAGARKQTISARTGYVVETYQLWYQGKELIDRRLLCKSTYKAYQETVEYND